MLLNRRTTSVCNERIFLCDFLTYKLCKNTYRNDSKRWYKRQPMWFVYHLKCEKTRYTMCSVDVVWTRLWLQFRWHLHSARMYLINNRLKRASNTITVLLVHFAEWVLFVWLHCCCRWVPTTTLNIYNTFFFGYNWHDSCVIFFRSRNIEFEIATLLDLDETGDPRRNEIALLKIRWQIVKIITKNVKKTNAYKVYNKGWAGDTGTHITPLVQLHFIYHEFVFSFFSLDALNLLPAIHKWIIQNTFRCFQWW